MQEDFHYYATYCAAHLAGHSPRESREISYCAQLVDLCSKTFLKVLGAPRAAATTQLQLELMDARTDIVGLQDITRIWSSFHFLPRDLGADPGRGGKRYQHKYQLICGPNGELLADTVELARGHGVQATGLAMHVLADTWAHQHFAGTPSLVINNVSRSFREVLGEGETARERAVTFRHNPSAADDLERGLYANSVYQQDEDSIMNLGHGRAGHLPDYSFARYRYLPAWAGYEEVLKDNPSDYWHAFCQMVYAMRCLRTGEPFAVGCYDVDAVGAWERDIRVILAKRQLDSCADWRALGERMVGVVLDPFDLQEYQQEYMEAQGRAKDETFLGRFFVAALAQKSMITNRIFQTGSLLAGISLDYEETGFGGIRDYIRLVQRVGEEVFHE
jgi:hypothetical protein